MKIRYAMKSRPGEQNENGDCIRMKEKNGAWLFAASDGCGSPGCGRIASETAVGSLIGRFEWNRGNEHFLRDAMLSSRDAVLCRQASDIRLNDISASVTALLLEDDMASWANAGSTRLYYFRRSALAGGAMSHGVSPLHPFHLTEGVQVHRGDSFLLCSDGFWKNIEEEQIGMIRKNAVTPVQWLRRMSDVVRQNGEGKNMDNYSAICVLLE